MTSFIDELRSSPCPFCKMAADELAETEALVRDIRADAQTAHWHEDIDAVQDRLSIALSTNHDLRDERDFLRDRLTEVEAALRRLWWLRVETPMTGEAAYDAMFKSAGRSAWEAAASCLRAADSTTDRENERE